MILVNTLGTMAKIKDRILVAGLFTLEMKKNFLDLDHIAIWR